MSPLQQMGNFKEFIVSETFGCFFDKKCLQMQFYFDYVSARDFFCHNDDWEMLRINYCQNFDTQC